MGEPDVVAADTLGPRGHRGTARNLLLACHPLPALAVTAFAVALGVALGLGAGDLVLVAVAIGTGQLSIGWSNDRIDAARDAAACRRDKPTVDGGLEARTLDRTIVGALLACTGSSLALGAAAGGVHLLAVASAWAYNARLKSTIFSWLPYAVSFGLLPAVVTLAAGDGFAPAWVLAAAALLGVGAHLANTLPDLADDLAAGVRGLPHRLGRRGATVATAVVLLAGTAVVVLAPDGSPVPLALVGAVVALVLTAVAAVVAVRRPASRLPFTCAIGVAAVAVVLLVAAVTRVGTA
jgi:4-hydroxybenzoate polyprenyltransferase